MAADNSCLWNEAPLEQSTGHNNVAFGYHALLHNVTGSQNTWIGMASLDSDACAYCRTCYRAGQNRCDSCGAPKMKGRA